MWEAVDLGSAPDAVRHVMCLVSFCPEEFFGRPQPGLRLCVTPLLSACRCPEYGNDSIFNRLVRKALRPPLQVRNRGRNVFEGTKPKTHQIRLVLNCSTVAMWTSRHLNGSFSDKYKATSLQRVCISLPRWSAALQLAAAVQKAAHIKLRKNGSNEGSRRTVGLRR